MAIAVVVVLFVLISLQPSVPGQSEAKAGGLHVVGVKFDDMEMALRHNWKGLLDIESWSDIEQVASSWGHTVGLVSGGTVVAVGKNNYRQCNLFDWCLIFSQHKDLKTDSWNSGQITSYSDTP